MTERREKRFVECQDAHTHSEMLAVEREVRRRVLTATESRTNLTGSLQNGVGRVV